MWLRRVYVHCLEFSLSPQESLLTIFAHKMNEWMLEQISNFIFILCFNIKRRFLVLASLTNFNFQMLWSTEEISLTHEGLCLFFGPIVPNRYRPVTHRLMYVPNRDLFGPLPPWCIHMLLFFIDLGGNDNTCSCVSLEWLCGDERRTLVAHSSSWDRETFQREQWKMKKQLAISVRQSTLNHICLGSGFFVFSPSRSVRPSITLSVQS